MSTLMKQRSFLFIQVLGELRFILLKIKKSREFWGKSSIKDLLKCFSTKARSCEILQEHPIALGKENPLILPFTVHLSEDQDSTYLVEDLPI